MRASKEDGGNLGTLSTISTQRLPRVATSTVLLTEGAVLGVQRWTVGFEEEIETEISGLRQCRTERKEMKRGIDGRKRGLRFGADETW